MARLLFPQESYPRQDKIGLWELVEINGQGGKSCSCEMLATMPALIKHKRLQDVHLE